MKVMKSIFILLAVLGLNLSVLAQQNNQGGNQQANESVEKIDELLKGELVPEDDDKNLTEEQKRRKKAIQEQEALWKNPDFKGYDKISKNSTNSPKHSRTTNLGWHYPITNRALTRFLK